MTPSPAGAPRAPVLAVDGEDVPAVMAALDARGLRPRAADLAAALAAEGVRVVVYGAARWDAAAAAAVRALAERHPAVAVACADARDPAVALAIAQAGAAAWSDGSAARAPALAEQVWRRAAGWPNPRWRLGARTFDSAAGVILDGPRPIPLKRTEAALLRRLCAASLGEPARPTSHRRLARLLPVRETAAAHREVAVRRHLAALRRKLGDDLARPAILRDDGAGCWVEAGWEAIVTPA